MLKLWLLLEPIADKKNQKMIRTYSNLILLPSLEERYFYLKLRKGVGERTFGSDRFLNQNFYKSDGWKRIRELVIIRDNGCDLGISDYPISGKILIHHMNPISLYDIKIRNEDILNLEFLISTSERTHQAIHYGDVTLLPQNPIVRKPMDTMLWRKDSK